MGMEETWKVTASTHRNKMVMGERDMQHLKQAAKLTSALLITASASY